MKGPHVACVVGECDFIFIGGGGGGGGGGSGHRCVEFISRDNKPSQMVFRKCLNGP